MTQQSQAITRKSASNLALAFILLPKPKREAMSALYAFCREVDDVADEETAPVEARREGLERWRQDARTACDGGRPSFAVNQELQPFIRQYKLPFQHFDELIRGCEMDLETSRYADFPALEQYCYRVASVVGLLSVEIFGYISPKCRDYAVYLGKALQLTNILRDVRTDAERGRIYLPQSELERCEVREKEILHGGYSERFVCVAEAVATEARKYYRLARQSLPDADRRSMVAAQLMGSVYWRLLCQLERQRFNVFGPKLTRVSKLQKTLLVFRSWFYPPDYGTD